MKNQELAKILFNISLMLETEKVSFKPQAYSKAALSLQAMEEDVEELYLDGGIKALEEIPGVGKSIALTIEEYLKTGKIKYYEELKKKLPIDFGELLNIEGMGPKRARILYQKLGIKTLKDLEKAAKAGKIRGLAGFGEKTEKNILEGIVFHKKGSGRVLLGHILPIVESVIDKLKKQKGVERISYAGSLRRMKETIGDADILIVSKNPAEIMDFFVSLPGVVKVWAKGPTKSSIRMEEGFDMDLRVVPAESYGAALQYFTGSKEHNVATRIIAIEKGYKLNEYGLFKGKKSIAGANEEDIYKAIGLKWIPPEIRENSGEIEAAFKNKLPQLIGYNDVRGDLHCHSNWDGGKNSITEMAKAAIDMGYEYIGISDHTKFLRIEHGLDEKQLLKQRKEIESLKFSNFRVIQGCESNILNDGRVDIKDEVLEKLDYVIAGVHSKMKMPKPEITERIIRAMKNPHVDIISHPTGRLIQRRDEFQIDFDKILRAAKETGTILEINSFPERLDLRDIYIRRAKNEGVKMIINTDSHRKEHLKLIRFGISQARRGWAEKKDVVNTLPIDKLLEYF